MPKAPYGSCPECGRLGVSIDEAGIVTCPNGHRYQMERPEPPKQEAPEEDLPQEIKDAQVQPGWGQHLGVSTPSATSTPEPFPMGAGDTPVDVLGELDKAMKEYAALKTAFESIRAGLQSTLQEVETILSVFHRCEAPECPPVDLQPFPEDEGTEFDREPSEAVSESPQAPEEVEEKDSALPPQPHDESDS